MSAFRTLCLAVGLMLAGVAPAFAHAHLVSSTPAVGETVSPPSQLKITFSEGIEIGLSKFELTGPSGTEPKPQGAKLDPADNRIVLIPLGQPLPAGTYTMHWHVVSVDTHRTEGTYSFTVK